MTTSRRGVRAVSPDRMLEVLKLIADGRTNREIGSRLGISEDTVKVRARALFDALGARDRAHAVAIGYRLAILGEVGHGPSCASLRLRACDCSAGAR